MKSSAIILTYLLSISVGSSLARAESSELKALQEAVTVRSELATAVAKGTMTPAEGVAQLRRLKNASGLSLAPQADLGFAAMDVAHRLVASRQPAAAQGFFEVAEAALQQAIEQTPDSRAAEKGQYLRSVAQIRDEYLGKPERAKADLESASRLQPGDARTQNLLRQVAVNRGDRKAVIEQERRAQEGRP